MADRASIHIHEGQSNWVGSTVGADASATTPTYPPAQYYSAMKVGREMRDMNGGILGAGAYAPMRWLAGRWFELAGERSLHIMCAVPGSALLLAAAGGNGHWQAGTPGSLFDSSLVQVQQFLRGVNLSRRFEVSGVYVHSAQGEQDGDQHNGTTVTGPLYLAAKQALLGAWAAGISAVPGFTMTRYCQYRLGRRPSGNNAAGFDAIRAAQDTFVANNPATVVMAWDKATELGDLVVDANGDWVSGWAFTDDVHYTGAAFRAMGRGGAANLHAAVS